MTDELCAREGCGEKQIMHSSTATLADLSKAGYSEVRAVIGLPDGECVADGCTCTAFLAPEPPKPERKPYVVEMPSDVRAYFKSGKLAYDDSPYAALRDAAPLDEYLAAHPLPAPALCICGGTADDHDPVTGRCQHKAHRMLYSDSGSVIERLRCGCQKFEAQS